MCYMCQRLLKKNFLFFFDHSHSSVRQEEHIYYVNRLILLVKVSHVLSCIRSIFWKAGNVRAFTETARYSYSNDAVCHPGVILVRTVG